jgi:hypothetical protein
MTIQIYAKIAKVSSVLVGRLSADKRNTQQNYDYISADLVLQEAGRAMAENELVVIPTITAEATETINYVDGYGKAKSRFDTVIEFDMIIGDDTGTVTAHWLGRGTDYSSPDKAMYKAITSGHKYFLMKLFNIGVGNEDGEHDEPRQQAAPKVPPTPRPEHPAHTEAEQTGKPAVTDEQRKPSEAMLKKLYASGKAFYGDEWEAKRVELVKAVTKGRTDSSKLLTFDECRKLIDGISKLADSEPEMDDNGDVYGAR